MIKKRWPVILVLIFLLSNLIPTEVLSDSNFLLTPETRIGSDPPGQLFRKIYESVCVGLSIYKLDAIQKHSKEELIYFLKRICCDSDVRFDLGNMGMGKKGWTRYYPFSIGLNNFIMRIFLTEELQYQPKVTVLYEGKLESPAVTFQVLPSLNDILSDCKIKPVRTYSTANIDRSS